MDYRLLASGVVKAHGPHRIEPGAGGTKVPRKWVVWAEFRDVRTGATFALVADHKIAAVERAGHPRRDNLNRVRMWHEEDRAVGRVIEKLKPLGIPIFRTADENLAARRHSDFGYDEILQKRGLYSSWRVLGYPDRGTHGTRLIDYVWSTTRLAAPVRQRILGKYGWDHSILVVDLENEKATRMARSSPAVAAVKAPAPAGVVAWRPAGEAAVGGSLRRQQVASDKLIAEGVRAAGGSGHAMYVALVAAVGESDLIDVTHGNNAGPDSRGLFQQGETAGARWRSA